MSSGLLIRISSLKKQVLKKNEDIMLTFNFFLHKQIETIGILIKTNQMMKTLFKCITVIGIIFFMSCDSDDSDGMPPIEEVVVALTEHTQEDQMGAFAENAMVEFMGKVWSVGGYNAYSGTDRSSDVWSSDNGVNWVSVTSNQFEGRVGHTLTVYDGKMWLIGGVNNSGTYLSDVWSTTNGENWTLETNTPSYLDAAYHQVVVFNSKLYLIKDSSGGVVSVWSSVDGSTWIEETNNAFPSREKFEALVFNSEIYILGGRNGSTNYNEIWRSSDGITWTEVMTSSVFTPRYAHTATVYDDKVWVAGGFGTAPEGNLWYTEDMINWSEYTPIASSIGLYDHAALNYAGEIYLFGGYEGSAGGPYSMIGKIRSLREVTP